MRQWVIDAKNISRNFGDFCAVSPFNLKVEKSSIYGFLGPNGSGKSTTIRMLTGLLSPSSGELNVLGFKLPLQSELLKKYIGYMTQKFSLYNDLTISENLVFVANIYGLTAKEQKQRLQALLSTYELDTIKNQMVSSLSGGQKQRLALAAAVMNQPKLLFLDEPTSALDAQSEAAVQEALDGLSQGRMTLVIAHRLATILHADKIVVLDKGRVVDEGTHAELLARGGLYGGL